MRLACTVKPCPARFDVSEEDPDSTLSDVLAHLRAKHDLSHEDALTELARVDRAPEELT